MEELTKDEKLQLEAAMAELKQGIKDAKPKIIKIKDKIKNKEDVSDEEKQALLKFKRTMELIQSMRDQGMI